MQLYMALFTDADGYHESIDFWHDVYGIDSKLCDIHWTVKKK